SSGCPSGDDIAAGDAWLSSTIPMILASQAYRNNGAIFITWDEDSGSPIGMIVISPLAKGGGYHNSIHYTHSSTLRTTQEIFHVTPWLRDAANATDLSDLFGSVAGGNQPPVARCRDVTADAAANCEADVPASAVDNGSSDPDGT